ncbi:helix-turn-helix domain-containing protein [Sporomusa termitida]|uniref:HTH cro/C1-type domain-containing protein n=1 Tax=Sporomusa termitida TaxID=2377 RepID=A0A517DVK7_9FIRM|nr:helix-turn-helix domain-containing protein [Sporomusa termitida]QDR81392.1 hypothetical protein SPTER_27720 [Sporomusa termitida]
MVKKPKNKLQNGSPNAYPVETDKSAKEVSATNETPPKRQKMRPDYGEKYQEIGKRIAYYRRQRGLSQEHLAEKLKCSLSDIKLIEGEYGGEAGREWPKSLKRVGFLFEVAEALELGVPAFFLPPNEETFAKHRTD